MHITSDPGSVTRLSLCAFCRVTQIVTYIHTKSPKTQIVLLGILPRGGLYWEKDQAWIWPNRYTAAIAAVNAGYYVSALLIIPCMSLWFPYHRRPRCGWHECGLGATQQPSAALHACCHV